MAGRWLYKFSSKLMKASELCQNEQDRESTAAEELLVWNLRETASQNAYGNHSLCKQMAE